MHNIYIELILNTFVRLLHNLICIYNFVLLRFFREIVTKRRQKEDEEKAKLKEENEQPEILSPKPESVSPTKGKKSPKYEFIQSMLYID